MSRLLLRKLRRDAASRRPQLLAVVVTIFLGVALYAASYDAFLNLQASYQRLYDDLAFADFTFVGSDPPAAQSAAMPGVAGVEERVVADAPVRVEGAHKLLGRAIAVVPGEPPAVNGLLVLEGENLESGEGVLVEQHMAGHFDLGVGDEVELLTTSGWEGLAVRGVVASPEYLWPARSRQEVLTSPDDFGVVFTGPDVVGRLAAESVRREAAIRYEAGADRAALDTALRDLVAQPGVDSSYTAAEQPSQAALQEDVSGFGQMSFLFPVLFLGAAGMASWVLLTRLVLSQRGIIGLLRANGFGRRTIFAHYLALGLAVGAAGGVPGAVAGVLLGRAITGVYTNAISVPLTVVEFRPDTLAAGVVFGLASGALAALAPARRAARVEPAVAMRGITAASTGRASLVERLVPAAKRLPAAGKMVLRSVERSPGRSIATGIGVVLAAVLILASWGMLDTIQVLLDRQFQEVERQDAQVFLDDAAAIERLAALPGVAVAEPIAHLPVTLVAGDVRYATTLAGFVPDTSMHEFRLAGGNAATLPADGVYVGSAFRGLAAVQAGDRVTILADGLEVDAAIAGFVDEPLGTVVYGSLPGLAAAAGVPEAALVNSALLAFEPGADRAALRAEVSELDGVVAYVDAQALFETVQRYMGLFYAFVGVMLAFGAVMAFGLVFNTVSAGIAERAGEVGTLEANGVGRGAIGRLLSAETLLLVLLAVGPGLVLGWLAARGMMSTYSSDLFRFDAIIRPRTFVITGASIVAVGLASQLPVLRRVRELDVAAIVRERSL